jgi:penicillin-binding protein 2
MAAPYRSDLRVLLLGTIMLLGLAALAARLWWVQVARGPFYASQIANRSEVTVRIPSIRGEIRDRNGVTLVGNRASFDVDFYLPEMVREFRKRAGGDLPKVTYRATVRSMATDLEEPDLVRIVNSAVIPRLQELELAKDYSGRSLQLHYRRRTEVPFVYLEDIDFPTIAKFSEHDVGLPGVDIAVRPVREYVYGAFAAHLLGYVGKPEDLRTQPDIGKFNFYEPDVEGRTNVELAMDRWLRGTPGVRVLQRNVKGQIDRELRVDPPKPGCNVYLTLDARVQMIAEQAMRAVGRGAAVVVDPNNGDILASVSVPSYDPNIFVPSVSAEDWKTINADETDPLTNRAVSPYAPGSTYKIVTALAGLRKNLGTATRFTCSGGVTFGSKYMKCWVLDKKMPPHGGLALSDAIKVSCNAFFYQYGNAAGIENIDAVGEAMGLGQTSGIELGDEKPGILPGPAWLSAYSPRERWSNGHTANVSIGQGYVLATPLQMAVVAATVANGGVTWQPRLVDRVLDAQGNVARDDKGNPAVPAPRVRMNLHDAGVTDEQVELVRRGMWKVVHEPGGTAKAARIKGSEVGGKTGTAQFWRGANKDNHAWFICFAPYDKPRFAVAVIVQGAKAGGAVAAPIAAKILEESIALDKGFPVALAKLAPAPGSFKFIDSVNFEKGVPAQYAPDEEESSEHADGPDRKLSEAQGAPGAAKPDIKADADEQGSVSKKRPDKLKEDAPEKRREKRNVFEKIFGKRERAEKPREETAPERKKGRWPF